MIEPETARRQLVRIAEALPTYRGLLNKRERGRRIGSRWIELIIRANADGTHLVQVVDLIVTGKLETHRRGERDDRLVFTLIRESERLAAREYLRREQFAKYHDPAIKRNRAKPGPVPASQLFRLPADQVAAALEREKTS